MHWLIFDSNSLVSSIDKGRTPISALVTTVSGSKTELSLSYSKFLGTLLSKASIAFCDVSSGVNSLVLDNNISFKGYTKDEIQRHMAKAEKEMHYHENQVSHHSYLANHNLGEADMKSHINEVRAHQREVEHWKNEYQKWKWTKPDPEK